ncbi:hypothetical protein LY76DRAFT_437512 [Colletotrichum caudatum]|nr:hypothetical protein LY76DRAFT_437512 [Colletotrichum caudatum]
MTSPASLYPSISVVLLCNSKRRWQTVGNHCVCVCVCVMVLLRTPPLFLLIQLRLGDKIEALGSAVLGFLGSVHQTRPWRPSLQGAAGLPGAAPPAWRLAHDLLGAGEPLHP